MPLLFARRGLRAPATFVGSLALLLSLACATRASAQAAPRRCSPVERSRAEEAVDRGIALRERRADREAREVFRAALEGCPTGRLLAQLALVEAALGDFEAAERRMTEALSQREEAWIRERAGTLHQPLNQIRQQLGCGQIRLDLPEELLVREGSVRFDQELVGPLPLPGPVYVCRAEVRVVVQAEGYRPFGRTLRVRRGELSSLTAALEREGEGEEEEGPLAQCREATRAQAHELMREGQRLRERGRHGQARALFERASGMCTTGEILAQLGLVEAHLGDTRAAEEHLTLALMRREESWIRRRVRALRPSLNQVRAQLGMGAIELLGGVDGATVVFGEELVGRLPLAEPVRVREGAVRARVELEGYRPWARELRGRAGRTERAEVDLAPGPLALLRQGERALAQGDPEQALGLFEAARAQEESARALADLGLAEAALERWEEAAGHLGEALSASEDEWIGTHAALLQGSLEPIQQRLGLGTLVVRGGPRGAELRVNDETLGTLPVGPQSLRAGRLRIEAALGDYLWASEELLEAGDRLVVRLPRPAQHGSGDDPGQIALWTGVALGAAAIAVAVGLGVFFINEATHSAIDEFCRGSRSGDCGVRHLLLREATASSSPWTF